MSNTSAPARGYGITKADLDASRLVFVSLRDSVPKRKVAVPVPDGQSWEQFLEQVKSKLRLEGVGSVYFASTGEMIASLDGLEDIDELYVEEATAGLADTSGSHPSYLRSEIPDSQRSHMTPSSTRAHRQSSVIDNKINHAVSIGDDERTEDDEEKYSKRSSLLKRMAQRIFPDAFTPGLPVTSKSHPTPLCSPHLLHRSAGNEEKGAKKRRRRRGTDGKALLLLIAVLGSLVTMILLYVRSNRL